MDSTMISAAEAALRLRLTREALVRRIQRGDLAGRLVGGKWFVDRAALDEQTRYSDPAPLGAA